MNRISRGRLLALLALIIVLIAAVPAFRYYRYLKTHVSTDDAYVDGNIVLIAPKVAGTVSRLYVSENFIVSAGDLLATLDPRDFAVRVEQAKAQLANARNTVDQMFSQLAAAEAGDRLAEAQLRQAELDFKRAKMLKASGVESVEFYDRAQTSLNMARANRVLSQREIERARAALGGGTAEDHARYDRAIVEQAQAQLKAAELDLSYTKIDAPVAGVVTKKSVQVGHRVAIGQPLMSVVPVDSLYVTANYKETQLTDVRVGQAAEISADVYPGYEFRGHVDSISFATGSAFALLPPENATGNWVKVVQRVPVKIVLDEQMPKDRQLRVGLSVETSIDISNPNGPLLSSALQNARRDGALGRHPQAMSQPAPQPLVPR